jgi:hypothetical protein
MDRLAHRDEVDACLFQPGVVRGCDAVGDAGMERRVRDLVRARIRGDDLREMLRQAARRLPAAGAGVPAEGVPRDERRERVEKRGGIRGPVAGIVARVAREVVLEGGRAQMTQMTQMPQISSRR